MFSAAVCELAIPHFVSKTLFTVAQPSRAAEFYGFIRALVGCTVGYALSAAVRGTLFSIINNRLTQRLRTKLFDTLVRKETAFFDTQGRLGPGSDIFCS